MTDDAIPASFARFLIDMSSFSIMAIINSEKSNFLYPASKAFLNLGFFIFLSNVDDFLLIIITSLYSRFIIFFNLDGFFLLVFRKLVRFFMEAVCYNNFFPFEEKTQKSMWLRFKSINLVTFVSEFCFIFYHSHITH